MTRPSTDNRPPALRRILTGTPQTRQVQFRVSDAEYGLIYRAWRKSGLPTVSAYLRGKVLGTQEG